MDDEFLSSGIETDDNVLYNQTEVYDDFLTHNDNDNVNHFEAGSYDLNNINHSNQQTQQTKRQRASGEVLALLMEAFAANPSPTPEMRKKISEKTGMPERSVRIWFQNRRAKSKKQERQLINEKDEIVGFNRGPLLGVSKYDGLPLNLNKNYHFIDAANLSVGTWSRIKSGKLTSDNIFSVKNLTNLSPSSINDIMNNSTDLMIIISRKNFEVNYFFTAITDDSKTLFRIFYPISSVEKSTVTIHTDDDTEERTCETKIFLAEPPRFAVSFSKMIEQNNQWSICHDFSESHQVSDAISGSNIPHILYGAEDSLSFMNSLIIEYNSANVTTSPFSLPQKFQQISSPFRQQPSQYNARLGQPVIQHQQQQHQTQHTLQHPLQQPTQDPQQQQQNATNSDIKVEYPQSMTSLDNLIELDNDELATSAMSFDHHEDQIHLGNGEISLNTPSEFQNSLLQGFGENGIEPNSNDSFAMFLEEPNDHDPNLILNLNEHGSQLSDLGSGRF